MVFFVHYDIEKCQQHHHNAAKFHFKAYAPIKQFILWLLLCSMRFSSVTGNSSDLKKYVVFFANGDDSFLRIGFANKT